MVKVIVLTTEGTNCEQETAFAFKLAGAEVDIVHINQIFSGQQKLDDYQILALPGGFSYGDDVMSGKILANKLLYRLGNELRTFSEAGKLIIGICNGFQVLVRTGLLPFGNTSQQDASLIINDNAKFMSQWEALEIQPSNCHFTKGLEGIKIELPIAHGEGKFIIRDQDLLERLISNGQVVFKYTDNPNGSVADIAGICNPAGTVLGMMPHPERYVLPTHHYNWRRQPGKLPQGLSLFKNAVTYANQL